jgi:hypothetical protein
VTSALCRASHLAATQVRHLRPGYRSVGHDCGAEQVRGLAICC